MKSLKSTQELNQKEIVKAKKKGKKHSHRKEAKAENEDEDVDNDEQQFDDQQGLYDTLS